MFPPNWYASDLDYASAMGRTMEPDREPGIDLFVDWPGDCDQQRFTSWPDALRAISRFTCVLSCRVFVGVNGETDDAYVRIEYRPGRQQVAVYANRHEYADDVQERRR
jgi:hypothetical protein